MEQGSLRCDVNVSLRPSPDAALGTRTETKNVNSLRCVERAVRYEITPPGRRAGRRRPDHPGDPALARGHRRAPRRAAARRARRTTATSPSPTWCRSRPTPGLGRGAPRRRCRSCPRPGAPGCRPSWGFTDLEMRDVVNAGALDLIEATVAAGATPQSARKWWLTELARQRQRAGVELAELPITPAQVAAVQRAGRRRASSTTSWPARSSRACWPGRARRTRSSTRAVSWSSPTRARCTRRSTRHRRQPDVAEKIRDGKVQAAGALVGAVMKQMRGQADAGRVRELILERLTTAPRS